MSLFTIVVAIFIFSIITMLIMLFKFFVIKQFDRTDSSRLIGAIITFVSSILLLIIYRGDNKDSFDLLFKDSSDSILRYTGIPLPHIVIGILGCALIVAFVRAFRH